MDESKIDERWDASWMRDGMHDDTFYDECASTQTDECCSTTKKHAPSPLDLYQEGLRRSKEYPPAILLFRQYSAGLHTKTSSILDGGGKPHLLQNDEIHVGMQSAKIPQLSSLLAEQGLPSQSTSKKNLKCKAKRTALALYGEKEKGHSPRLLTKQL